MVGVPYAVLGALFFMIYRGCKQNEIFKKKAGEAGGDSFSAADTGNDSPK